jgi:hypothetical protein
LVKEKENFSPRGVTTMRYILAILLLCICVPAQGQFTSKHDASWWNQQTDTYKLGYLTGYEAANVSIQASCIAEQVSSIEGCGRIAHLFVLGLDEKAALARLDLFYKDRRNQDVVLELAITQVAQDIAAQAKSEYDRAQSLEIMRQVSQPKASPPATPPARP